MIFFIYFYIYLRFDTNKCYIAYLSSVEFEKNIENTFIFIYKLITIFKKALVIVT